MSYISYEKSNHWDFKPNGLKDRLANCKKIAIHCSVLAGMARQLNTKKMSEYAGLDFINHGDWAHDYMYATLYRSYLSRCGIKDIIIDTDKSTASSGWVKLKTPTASTESYRFQLEKEVDERGEEFYVLCIMHDKWYHGCGSNKWWY